MQKFNNMKEAMVVVEAKAILADLAATVGADVEYFDGYSCVNVSLLSGSFLCTAAFDTLLDNINQCIGFILDSIYRVPNDNALRDWCRLMDDYWF
jgi:hypothetical protein